MKKIIVAPAKIVSGVICMSLGSLMAARGATYTDKGTGVALLVAGATTLQSLKNDFVSQKEDQE